MRFFVIYYRHKTTLNSFEWIPRTLPWRRMNRCPGWDEVLDAFCNETGAITKFNLLVMNNPDHEYQIREFNCGKGTVIRSSVEEIQNNTTTKEERILTL